MDTPGSDRRLQYPTDEEIPFLEWYQGRFSSVFVAFHPFFEMPGVDPADVEDWETTIIVRNTADTRTLQDIMDEAERERVGPVSADEIEALIPRRARPVAWPEICKETHHATPAALNRSLLTHIHGLKREFEDVAGARRLEDFCARRKIFFPTEGQLQFLHRSAIATLFNRLGTRTVVRGDDLFLEADEIPIEELATPAGWTREHGIKRMWSPDLSALVTVHWDSYFTLFCISDGASWAMPDGLDGFWATHRDGHSWWL